MHPHYLVVWYWNYDWGHDTFTQLSIFHSQQNLVWWILYRDIIFSLPTTFGVGVIITWHHIFSPLKSGSRMWLYFVIIFSLLVLVSHHKIWRLGALSNLGGYVMGLYEQSLWWVKSAKSHINYINKSTYEKTLEFFSPLKVSDKNIVVGVKISSV